MTLLKKIGDPAGDMKDFSGDSCGELLQKAVDVAKRNFYFKVEVDGTAVAMMM